MAPVIECLYCRKEIDCSEFLPIDVHGTVFYAHQTCHTLKREGFCSTCLDQQCGRKGNETSSVSKV